MNDSISWADITPDWRKSIGERRVCGIVYEGAFAKCRIVLDRYGGSNVVHVDRLDDASVLLRDDVVRALREKISELTDGPQVSR